MTSRQLSALGRRFMRRLEMDEWIPNTVIRFARKSDEAEIGSACGYTGWCADRKQAWIYIAPLSVLQADETNLPITQVVGETVIHELLHLRLEGHKPEAESHEPAYELALNKTARAFWKSWGESGIDGRVFKRRSK